MELVSAEEFARRTAKLDQSAVDESSSMAYIGTPFQCACGEIHIFCPVEAEHLPATPVFATAPDMRLESALQMLLPLPPLSDGPVVVGCPDTKAATCVRLKGLLNRHIRSEFGTTDLPNPDEVSSS